MIKKEKNILPYIYLTLTLVDFIGIALILFLKNSDLF